LSNVRNAAGELEELIPRLRADPAAKARLQLLPDGQGAVELGLSGRGKAEPALAAVGVAAALENPATSSQDAERSREGGAIDGEDDGEPVLGNLSGEGERLEDGELSGAQAERAESRFIELGQGSGTAAQVRAEAGEKRRLKLVHAL
jgi:hypothetical protein